MSTTLPVVQSNPALLLNEKDNIRVIVHPLAILQVLDHHSRRQDASGRVIGTLLGVRSDDGLVATTAGRSGSGGASGTSSSTTTIEITNCFGVPHAERGEEVAIGKDFNRKMLALHMRSSKEVVVGWYASSKESAGSNASEKEAKQSQQLVTDTSSLIHEFYAGECDDNDPIHLVVDTRLVNECLQIKAYKSAPVMIQGDHVGNVFHELPVSLHCNEPETICLHEMSKGSQSDDTIVHKNDAAHDLQVSMEQLYELLESTLKYVDSVVDGTVATPPDAETGRHIADTLAMVPRVRPEILDKLFHNSLQDLLMVSYLSNLTRTQLEIAEKLNATLGSSA